MKITQITRKICLIFISVTLMLLFTGLHVYASANTSGYDTTRIYHAMAKARRGEPITIAVIGGSITAGSLASSEATRWANLMTDWWETTFPTSAVTMVNAGIGGTGSDLGTHRLWRDVLSHDPDFIVVEFSVNDTGGEYDEKMMEGLVRQTLLNDSLPGIMLILLKQQNGVSAQVSHKKIGNHYNVPMVSFADLIDAAVAQDGNTLGDIFVDGLHPNDLGMAYIAEFLTDELGLIYDALPDEGNLPAINTTIPDPLITDVYAHPFLYSTSSIIPSLNEGWTSTTTKWSASTAGSQLDFAVDGNAISFIYTRHNLGNRGQVEAWVDNGPHQTFDAYWLETWGPALRLALVQENLADGEHMLHIKVKDANTSGSDGRYFEVLNVCKAGNWTGTARIALAGENVKTLTGVPVLLDGTSSFDPDNDSILSWQWSIVSAPGGSIAGVSDATDSVTTFTPDIAGHYKIGLVVGDGSYTSVTGIKSINAVVSNTAPVAEAGINVTDTIRQFNYLDGTSSSDAEGDFLQYAWAVISQPVGTPININFMNTANPKYYAYTEGEYIFGLVVFDSLDYSIQDQVIVTVIDVVTGIQDIGTEGFFLKSYPNPAHNSIRIEYELSEGDNVSLVLFTIAGVKIDELKNGYLPAGRYALDISIGDYNLSGGSYLIELKTSRSIFYNRILKY